MWIAATLCICAGLLCLMLDETAPRVLERHKRMIVSSPA
jgi:hypothetical protein